MIKLGLTGSIAMGKSTTAEMFREAGAWVHDSDAAVHRLYDIGGAAVPAILALAPEAIVDAAVDRARLGALVQADPQLLKRVEEAVHPLVAMDREQFVVEAAKAGVDVVVFDIPLLFETGADLQMDAVVVVTASPATQKRRALMRPGMTSERLNTILSRQTPDEEKRRRADFIVDTEGGLDVARSQVKEILREISSRTNNTV